MKVVEKKVEEVVEKKQPESEKVEEKSQPVKQSEVEKTRPTFDENLRRIMHDAEMIGARNRSIMRYEADRMYHNEMLHHEAQRNAIAYH